MLTIDKQRFLKVPKLYKMMKVLSIQTTILPNGDKPIQWNGKMPVHFTRELHTNQFNQWNEHIHNELLKLRMWNKIISKIKLTNTVNPGGVAHIDGQESALRLAKEILS